MTPDPARSLALIRSSGRFQADWYLRQYPDVALLGMDPAEHYLRFGAALGRDPSDEFETQFYLQANAEAAQSGLNPLVHYVLHGQERRLACRSKGPDPVRQARGQIERIRSKLNSLGFTRQPLAELEEILRSSPNAAARAGAAWELAVWAMRARTEDGYRAALAHLATARLLEASHDVRRKLVVLELLCHHFLGQVVEGRAAYEWAALAGESSPSAMLACANFERSPATRIAWINEVLRHYDLPPLALLTDAGLPAYDRLAPAQPLATITGGPTVTVLIATYDAAAMIPTTLRALQEQTWANLEIIVVDDCSPTDDTCEVVRRFASADPRIRLIGMDRNGGAYVARNRGLDEATGTYVTIHDADDWSHPLKIETQVRFMERTPEAMGCTTEQARATSDLSFLRWNAAGSVMSVNVSSFLWRREPVREALGYWDTVRFSADSELIRRIERVFGPAAVHHLGSGPLSFQRHSEASIMTDDVMGMNGFYYGARKEYFDAQRYHHASGASLRYGNDPAARPFPAPALMRPERRALLADRHFDIVLAGDFRVNDDRLTTLIDRVRSLRGAGSRVGLVDAFDYECQAAGIRRAMHDAMRAEVDGEAVQILVYGDEVTCDVLEVVTPNGDLRDQRYAPVITVRPRAAQGPPKAGPGNEASAPRSDTVRADHD